MKKNNKLFIIIIVVFALVFLGACGYLVYKNFIIKSAEDAYNKLASSVVSQETTVPSLSFENENKIDKEYADNPVDFDTLIEDNEDIYSWIYVPDTNIDYPVVQSHVDDNYYLDHDIYGNYSFPGAIYSQVCNSTDWNDRVTVLYGHNMLNGSMFANLHYFEDRDYFDENRHFYIFTPTRKLTYDIVAAFVYDDRHIMNSFDFKDDKVFKEFLDSVKNPRSIYSNVREDIELNLNSKLVVLSTCVNYGEGRYLVIGVQANDEPTE
ncbi:MAG: class B sortase [Ruminococcus sp.]|nr:class B sortase [Ruminococcus sp.]